MTGYSCEKGSHVVHNPVNRKMLMSGNVVSESCTLEFENADTLAVKKIEDNEAQSDSSINFASISSDTNGKGLYITSDLTRTEDIDGDGKGEEVYYFRGAVENNYVVFADFCWRIVRTNEDGSVKLRYGGNLDINGYCPQTGTDVKINNTTYGFNPSYGGSKYNQYVYDTNTNSTAKSTIDTWYKNNIANKGENVTKLISDVPYCNDMSGTTSQFGAYNRLVINKTPQYKCPNPSDKYTVSTDIGNGKLIYPVALITADEVAYAGGVKDIGNTTFYLYYGGTEWIMSPATNGAHLFYVQYGNIGHHYPHNARGLIPVISINSDAVCASGTGLYNDPYIIG